MSSTCPDTEKGGKIAPLLPALAFALALAPVGCATIPRDPVAYAEYERRNDPFEPANRAIFAFNRVLDKYAFRPLAEGYGLLPAVLRDRIHNLLATAQLPVKALNAILQGDSEAFSNVLGRTLVNLTIGIGGLFDVASAIGIRKVDSDFGLTLGKWGVPSGPYLMLPVLGPSNVRHAVGRGVDSVMDPVTYLYAGFGVGFEANTTHFALNGIDARYEFLDELDELERGSLDFYAALRSFYQQFRASAVGGGLAVTDESLYDEDAFLGLGFDSGDDGDDGNASAGGVGDDGEEHDDGEERSDGGVPALP